MTNPTKLSKSNQNKTCQCSAEYYIDYGVQHHNDKDPNLKVGDHLSIKAKKIFFQKATHTKLVWGSLTKSNNLIKSKKRKKYFAIHICY